MSDLYEMKASNKNGVCRVELSGELNIYSAAELKQKLDPLVSDCNSLEFDLMHVSEIDTACLQVLIQAKREFSAQGRKMELVGHSPAILEILNLYGLEGFFGDPLVLPPTGKAA